MDFLDFNIVWVFYQKCMFLLGVTAGEYGKIGRFVNEFMLLLIFLQNRGWKTTKKQAVSAYFVIVIIAVLIGRLLVSIGTVKINNDIANSQNPQMVEILERIKNIEEKIK